MQWLDAIWLIDHFGATAVWVTVVMIFLETGVIITSFLPGDSLLFLLGLAIASDSTLLPIWIVAPLLFVAAAAGSQVSYELGLRVGLPLVEKRRIFFLTPNTIAKSHAYFEKYGARAVVLARFVPILRALVPVLAGISYLPRRDFVRYNLIGAASWAIGMTVAGYALGNVPAIRENLELAILGVIVITSLPFPIELLREWIKARQAARSKVAASVIDNE